MSRWRYWLYMNTERTNSNNMVSCVGSFVRLVASLVRLEEVVSAQTKSFIRVAPPIAGLAFQLGAAICQCGRELDEPFTWLHRAKTYPEDVCLTRNRMLMTSVRRAQIFKKLSFSI